MALIEKNNAADNIHILLAKYLSRETDATETGMVEAWIAESADNKKYADQLQLIWLESKKFANNKKPDAQAALEKFRDRMAVKPVASISGMYWLRIAAMVVIIAGLVTIIRLTNHSQIKPDVILKFSAGNIAQSDTLPDGSVVQLQPHAELSCPAKFPTTQRNVTLKGDAYFSVLHDANRPFQISVNDIKVTVLGTSFKISDSSGNTEVDVITGIVQVTKEERSIKVFPHEKLIVPASNSLWIKQSDTVSHIQFSKQNQLPKNDKKKLLQIKHAAQSADTIVNDYSHQRQVMISILNDLVSESLVADRKSIVWAALTDSVLIVNGETQPEALHQKIKTKYHIVAEQGYYYGPVQITGKGYFFDSKELKQ